MSVRLALAYHTLAFAAGFFMDLLLGDPRRLPHPICLIGKLIVGLEKVLLDTTPGKQKPEKQSSVKQNRRKRNRRKQNCKRQCSEKQNSGRSVLEKCEGGLSDKVKFRQGILLVVSVILCTVTVTALLLGGAYVLHPLCGLMVESIMTWQILAAKSLKTESMKVYTALKQEGLPAARRAVSMIVGRDTDQLDEAGVIRAAVETVAENTSDGVIAPMLYLCLGGPILGFFYKAVNTMDSMIGYKNEKYLYFGRAAAKLDDAVNYIPARISAWLMILSCIPGKEFDAGKARMIHKRDHGKHASPNSAQTESVCAGALHIRLAGPASYFGKKVDKPYIGDAGRQIEPEDIIRANRLMMRTAWLGEALCMGAMGGILWML